jgi:urease accessory protein
VEGDPKGMTSLYLQSCAGGLFEDDALHINVTLNPGAAVHFTTQASTIVHSKGSGASAISSSFTVGPNALLEALTDPYILFPASSLTVNTRLAIDPTATAIFADAFFLHDPRGGQETFARLATEMVIEVGAKGRVACDRYETDGSTVAAGTVGVTGQYRVQGTFLAVAPSLNLASWAVDLYRTLESVEGLYAGISTLPGDIGIWCRILAADPPVLRTAQDALWKAIRLRLCGRLPRSRRK